MCQKIQRFHRKYFDNLEQTTSKKERITRDSVM